MNKIIFILVMLAPSGVTTYKFTDLQPDGTFTAYYKHSQFPDERKMRLLPEEVEELAENATQIIQVEIN